MSEIARHSTRFPASHALVALMLAAAGCLMFTSCQEKQKKTASEDEDAQKVPGLMPPPEESSPVQAPPANPPHAQ